MAVVVNFTPSLNLELTELSIEDSSSENYDNLTVASRQLEFEFADGTIKTFPFPLVLGVGDVFIYPVTADIAVTVTMTLVFSPFTPHEPGYKTINLLLANYLQTGVNALRVQVFMVHYNDENDTEFYDQLRKLELIDGFLASAKDLVASSLTGASKALAYGNAVLMNYKSIG
jgi:hypothetical protein